VTLIGISEGGVLQAYSIHAGVAFTLAVMGADNESKGYHFPEKNFDTCPAHP
jgi:hypothetical protein